MLTVAEAHRIILDAAHDAGEESVDLTRAAGRILREPVFADRDYPPINRATMDGIAVRISSRRAWTIEATIAAGQPASPLRNAEAGCARIMTGAEVPSNADAVIPVEDLTLADNTAAARDLIPLAPGQNIHARGIDRQAGDQLLAPGVRLDAPRIAILAAVGRHPVRVSRRPRIALLSTGNEIVPVAQRNIAPFEVRGSNLVGLQAALIDAGMPDITAEHVPDDPVRIRERIAEFLANREVLILSGGVSKGAFDFVPDALERCGVQRLFHRVAQKPGKPLWFGQTATCTVFGLPGNPVSTLTVFRRYVVPYLLTAQRATRRPAPIAITTASIKPHATLTTFPPVTVRVGDHGRWEATPVVHHGSGDFASLADSDGFLEVPPGASAVPRGTLLPFLSWRGSAGLEY